MTLHYAPGVRNSGPSKLAPDGWRDDVWHQDATGDTGTSHTLPGRLFIVQCEWCDDAFAAYGKAEALAMFREHEKAMLAPASPSSGVGHDAD